LQLQRLGHLIGEPRYLEAARRTMALFAADVQRVPQGFATLVTAMAEYRSPPTLVMLTGPPAATAAWRAELAKPYLPSVIPLQLPDDTAGLPAMLARPCGTHPQAWVCRGTACLPPIADIQSLLSTVS
jgi:uncharacterized protein YyaL (SSP411 family)